MTDRITIATDMARERLAEAKLGVRNVRYPIEFPNGSVNLVVTLTVSAADIDAQIEMERERGVERKAEDARPVSDERLTDEQLTGMDMWDRDVMLDERHRAVGAMLVRMAVAEIREHRAAIARVKALVAQYRSQRLRLTPNEAANDIEAALRGERSGK